MSTQNLTRTRWIAIVVVTWAALQSVVYFGHQAVPNPDFTAFKYAADRVLDGGFPAGEKRTPALGLIQHALGLLLPGPYRQLTAGWLLNAILHPLAALAFFALARKRIGDAFAGFLSLALFSNPQVLRALVQPLTETVLLFLALAFFWALERRSKAMWWIAGLATAIRYDLGTLIGVACVFALVEASDRRGRLAALGKSALAALPAAAWLVAVEVTWPAQHYGANYLHDVQAGKVRDFLGLLLQMSWDCVAWPYLAWAPMNHGLWWRPMQMAFMAAVALLLGVGAWRALRLRDKVLLGAMLHAAVFAAFLLSYWVIPRYCGALGWVCLLIGACGLHELGSRLPRASAWPGVLRWMVLLGALAWSAVLVHRWVWEAKEYPESFMVLALTGAALVAITLIAALPRPFEALPGKSWLLPGAAVFGTMLMSDYRNVAEELSDGHYEYEFRELAAWLGENATSWDHVYTSSPELVHYFLEPNRRTLISIEEAQGDTALELFEFCERKRAVYVCILERKPIPGSPVNPIEVEIARLDDSLIPYRPLEVFENPRHGTKLWVFGRSQPPDPEAGR